MACGILATGITGRQLRLRKAKLPLMEELAEALTFFEVDDAALKALKDSLSQQSLAHRLPGFTDIMGMWSDWIPVNGSCMNTVDNPFSIPVVTMGERAEARVVWRWLLKQRQSSLSDQLKRVLQIYDDWESSEPKRFYESYRVIGNKVKDEKMMAYFKSIFNEANMYLTSPPMSRLLFTKLLRKHINVNAHSLKQAQWRGHDITYGPGSQHYQGDAMFIERAFFYAENVTKVVREMESSDGLDPIERPCYEDAWWMLMLRLQAWTMGIKVVNRDGAKIPSHYYDNKTRVYIL